VPDCGTQDVVDHAMGLMLGRMKGINRWDSRLRAAPKEWNQRDNSNALRLSAAKVGIVGLGRMRAARGLRCKAFGMEVPFFDPYVSNGSDLALNTLGRDSLEALFSASHIVKLHVPLSDGTRACQPGLVLINVTRGEVADIVAIYRGLQAVQFDSIGIDVMPEEPSNMDRSLIQAWRREGEWIKDRVLIAPHCAF
jgi:phosphoglycerate dehydrogenase-like enzyme